MRVVAFARLVVATTIGATSPAAAQSTTAPQAAPSMPPGETPPEAARDSQGSDYVAAPGKSNPAKPAPNRDPRRDETR